MTHDVVKKASNGSPLEHGFWISSQAEEGGGFSDSMESLAAQVRLGAVTSFDALVLIRMQSLLL